MTETEWASFNNPCSSSRTSRAIVVKDTSSLYETEPLGVGNAQWFVNAVATIDTTLSADQMLNACADIENRLIKMHGPITEDEAASPLGRRRIIDLDILFFGGRNSRHRYAVDSASKYYSQSLCACANAGNCARFHASQTEQNNRTNSRKFASTRTSISLRNKRGGSSSRLENKQVSLEF